LSNGSFHHLFGPAFYAAPAFNSVYVGLNSRFVYQIASSLRAQEFIEKCRYVKKKGYVRGYTPRFAWDQNLADLFKKTGNLTFPPCGRAPVGLNPERFIAVCKKCSAWLHGYDFHEDYCEKCEATETKDAE